MTNEWLDEDTAVDVIAEVIAEIRRELRAEIAELKAQLATIETKGVSFEGVFQRAQSYRRGSMVVYEGSLFAATRSTQPGEIPGANAAWQLAAKAGRDGKDMR